jgi:antitoxin PrlF
MGKGTRRTTVDATLTSKGQLTVPASVRRAMGVTAGDKLRFAPAGGGFVVTPLKRGNIMDLDGAFASVKRLGAVDIRELRRRAARGRAKVLEAQR